MSRWFRLYDDVINDPKVLCLPEAMRWQWIAVMCIASKHSGELPSIDHMALLLRLTKHKAAAVLTTLATAGLLDQTETGFRPHNWDARQFKSDVSTPRVKRFRQQQRNVSETPPDTEAETDKNPEANASGAVAPRDIRADLFGRGLTTLAKITGKTPDSCRSLVGKWLKSVNDEAIHVLGAIDDAERNKIADPVAWINKVLQAHGRQNGTTKRTVHDAAADLHERLRSFDEPAPSDLRSGEGTRPVRLISSG